MTYRSSDTPHTAPAVFEDVPYSGTGAGRRDSLVPGQVIGRYEVCERLGEGATATVYRVRHRQLESDYALKVLHLLHPDLLGRLITEGQLQSQLEHPHIVRVHDVVEVGSAPALLMDYVAGPSLADRLKQGALSFDEAEAIFRQILDAVAFAHSHAVIHRDLKPANVLLTQRSGVTTARVTDFGIAKHLAPTVPTATMTGGLLGTLEYMAPEQIRGEATIDGRADLFALGVILFEMCAGRRPFAGEHLVRLLSAIDRAEYGDLEAICPAMPERLKRAIRACLVSRPDGRVPDCGTLRSILDGAVWEAPVSTEEEQVRASSTALGRRWRQGLVAIVIVAIGLGAALIERHWSLVGERERSDVMARSAEARLSTARLVRMGWERTWEQPGEALALFRAAHALGESVDGAAVLTPAVLFDLTSRGAAVKLFPMGEQVSQVAYSPDGRRIAGGTLEGEVVIWETETGVEVLRFEAGLRSRLMGLSFTPDGASLLILPESGDPSPGRADPARLFDATTGKLRHSFSHGGRTARFEVSRDGRLGASLGYDHRVLLWDLATGAPLQPLGNARDWEIGSCLAFSPDGRFLVVGYSTPTPQASWSLFDLSAEVARERRLPLPPSVVGLRECQVSFSDDGSMLIGASGHGLTVWNPMTAEIISSAEGLNWRVLSPDPLGVSVAHGTPQGAVVLRRLPELMHLGELAGHKGQITRVRYGSVRNQGHQAPGPSWLVTAGVDGTLGLWSGSSVARLGELKGNRSWILDLATAVTERGTEVASAGRDGVLRVWPLWTPPAQVESKGRLVGDEDADVAFRFISDDGGHLLMATRDHHLWEWTADQGTANWVARFNNPLWSVARNESGQLAMSVRSEGVYVFDGGESPRRAAAEDLRIWLSPDGDKVVVGGFSRIEFVDVRSGHNEVFAFDELVRLTEVDWAAMRVIVVDNRSRIHRVELDGSGQRQIWPSGGEEAADLRLSKDSRLALVSFWGGGAEVWDIVDGERLTILEGHTDSVTRVAFSPDGVFAATGSEDRTARLWLARTGETVAEIGLHSGQLVEVAFSSRGRRLLTAGLDHRVCVWRLPEVHLESCHPLSAAPKWVRYDDETDKLRVLDVDDRLWTWPSRQDLTRDEDLLVWTGELTNLRVCRDSLEVVAVLPFPTTDSVWAPQENCTPE
jgi:WD40 repeat protein